MTSDIRAIVVPRHNTTQHFLCLENPDDCQTVIAHWLRLLTLLGMPLHDLGRSYESLRLLIIVNPKAKTFQESIDDALMKSTGPFNCKLQ